MEDPARLYDLTNATDISSVITYLKTKVLKQKKFFRIIPSLQFLLSLGLELADRPQSSGTPLSLVEELRRTFEDMHMSSRSALVYTDGSTSVRSSSLNSGCSIIVTDEKHNHVWSGGMVVRTDRNNFIAELAAASVVVK